jgi:PAS domain S-box-containing protein
MVAHNPPDRAEATKVFTSIAPLPMMLLDLTGRVVEVSPMLLKNSGLQREDLLGRDVAEIMPTAGAEFLTCLNHLASGEEPCFRETTVRRPEGADARLRTHSTYWRNDAGAVLGVLAIYQDITLEHNAVQSRLDSEANLRAIVDHLPAGVAVADAATGEILLMNAPLRERTAAPVTTAPGVAYRETLPPLSAKLANDLHFAALASDGVLETEFTPTHGGGAGRTTRLKAIRFASPGGREQFLWIIEDVTALREALEALEQSAAEAKAASRAKSEFLANMSHEIRTPLNGVMGVAGALARTNLEPRQQEMVSIIETSAKTLETLLSDILDLARIEAGKMELKIEPFDLLVSVKACGALFDAAAQAKGLDLEINIQPNALGRYLGDAARLRQVLCNLLGNAVKFTSSGRVRLSVETKRYETSSTLTFVVSDTGIGFDAETKARLFSRFEQADGSIRREFGGSGLGLAISRSLAEAMGGRLDCEAEPGKGACFTFSLHLERCEGGADIWDRAAEEEPEVESYAGLRVLVAEDHPTNRRVVELILGSAGVDLTLVENGLEALQAFQQTEFDLILMDMQMPVMDGLTAIEEIRAIELAERRRPTPIHVLTANAMPEHVVASHQAGADGHLSKPILADALLERVAMVARAKQPGTRRAAAEIRHNLA